MDSSLIFIVLMFSFLVRAFPRILKPNAIVSDTYFHLYRAKEIRKNHFKLSRKLSRVILPHENNYPFLYHYFLSIFSDNLRHCAERFTGAFFDTVNVSLVYFFTKWILHHDFYDNSYNMLPLIIATFYAFSPGLLRIGSGPRAYNGSPRTMGQTLYLLHLMFFLISIENCNLIFMILSIALGSLLFITAKFSVQVFIFFGIFFIIFVYPVYFLIIFVSLILSNIFTMGKTLHVLKGQIKHSIFYYKYLQKIFLYPDVRTSRSYFLSVIAFFFHIVTLRFTKVRKWYFSEPFFLHLLLMVYPHFVIIIFLLPQVRSLLSVERFLFIWALSGLIFFLLTKIRFLMFLGEGERYLEYALFPSLYFFAKFLYGNYQWLWLWFFYSVFCLINYYSLYFSSYDKLNKDFSLISESFQKLNQSNAIAIWPIGSHHFETLYHSNLPVLTHGVNFSEAIKSDFMLVYGNYPFPSGEWEKIINKYHISHIVSDKTSLNYYLKTFVDFPDQFLDRLDTITHNDSLVISKIY